MNRRLAVLSGVIAAAVVIAAVVGAMGISPQAEPVLNIIEFPEPDASQNPTLADDDTVAGKGADMPPTGILADDDTVASNGIDELVIDILANDIFEGPISVTLEPDYLERYIPEWIRVNDTYTLLNTTRHHSADIIGSIGPAVYNGTHLVYTPSRIALSEEKVLARYTYTIRDETGRSDSANVTINITRPVASAAVSDTGPDPAFLIAAYSTDPISGRILDDAGAVIYRFSDIKPAVDAGWVAIGDYWNSLQVRIFSPPVITEDIPDDPHDKRFDCDGSRGECKLSIITVAIPEFDEPLKSGTYTYQFARTIDSGYAGSDVYSGTFTVPEHPAPPAPPSVPNRDPVASDVVTTVPVHSSDERYAFWYSPYIRGIDSDIYEVKTIRPPVSDPDGDQTVITSVTGGTLGTVFDQFLSRGIIVYAANSTGMDIIQYTVSDGRRGADTGTISIYINEPGNARPAFSFYSPDLVDAKTGQDLRFAVGTVDFDGDPVDFRIVNAPDDNPVIVIADSDELPDNITSTGLHIPFELRNKVSRDQAVFDWMMAGEEAGLYAFTIIAHDGHGGVNWRDIRINMSEGQDPGRLPDGEVQNDEPEFVVTYNGAVPHGTIQVTGNLTTLEVQAADPEGDPITITAIPDDLMPEVTVSTIDHTNGTAMITINSTGVDAGTYVLWIKVADDQGNYDREPYAMEIGPPEPDVHVWLPRPEPAAPIPDIVVSAEMIESATIPQVIADSSNDFAIDFYRQVSDSDKNIFFSPASIYVAFSVLYEGARENTASQIQDVFGFEPDAAERHNATAHAMASLNRDDPHATLNMANALWIANWFAPYDTYLDIARSTYLADAKKVNFTDANDGVKKINNWAANKTNDRINEVITEKDVSRLTAAVITNAIYFKGTWITEFPKEDTDKSDFWINADSSKKADFMNVNSMFNYTESDGAQVLKMPYKGDRLSMLVILPSERNGLAGLEETISAQQISNWIHDLRELEVIVSMPKFETKTNYDLMVPLKSMGMIDAFSDSAANLRGIAHVEPGRNLYVHKAVHDAYVKVNEEGTEAAAVTTVVVYAQSEPPATPRFIADHPFLFTIYDEETGMILFMGRISDPTV